MPARRALAAAATAFVFLTCHQAERAPDSQGHSQPSPSQGRLQIKERYFRTSAGRPFQWRGITAFRLLDYVADAEEAKATEYLKWVAAQGLTVVRVLAMNGGFFDLKPADGRAALPKLLELAADRGLQVEVVGLAGTATVAVDLDEHIGALGRILASYANGLLEIANEPVHPTQAPEVHNPNVLKRLASRVPADVLVALGSVERGEGFADGRYITWHVPRDDRLDGWGHVLALPEGDAFLQRWKKPVVSDEPIGAAAERQPGRRDNIPARFRVAALLTRLVGLGATFHYDGGLQARIPQGRELECFRAWNEAWTLLPRDVEEQGIFVVSGGAGAIVEDYDRTTALGVYERRGERFGWIVAIGKDDPRVRIAPGWRVADVKVLEGARLMAVQRASP